MYPADFATSHKHHAFLSYNTPDLRQVEVVKAALDRAGLRPFFAPVALRSGMCVHHQLASEIDNSSCLVLFIGPNGVGPYQLAEADYAWVQQRPIIKIVLRDRDLK